MITPETNYRRRYGRGWSGALAWMAAGVGWLLGHALRLAHSGRKPLRSSQTAGGPNPGTSYRARSKRRCTARREGNTDALGSARHGRSGLRTGQFTRTSYLTVDALLHRLCHARHERHRLTGGDRVKAVGVDRPRQRGESRQKIGETLLQKMRGIAFRNRKGKPFFARVRYARYPGYADFSQGDSS